MTISKNVQTGVISTNNSTSTPLGSSATFTGVADDVAQYSQITVNITSDVNSLLDGISLEFSPDGTNWFNTTVLTMNDNGTNFQAVHVLVVIAQYFRVVYQNGTSVQTIFNIQTIYHQDKSLFQPTRSDEVLNKTNDALLVRKVSDIDLDRAQDFIEYEKNIIVQGSITGLGTSFETVWFNAGLYPFPTTAETLQIAAGGDVNDVAGGTGAREVTIEGLDGNLDEVSETLVTNGAVVSAVTVNSYRRVNRFYVSPGQSGTYGGGNIGDIVLENTMSTTTLASIPAGDGQQNQCVYTVPVGKTAYLQQFFIDSEEANTTEVLILSRENADDVTVPFDPVITKMRLIDHSAANSILFKNPMRFSEKTDIYLNAQKQSGGGNTSLSVTLFFTLIEDSR